MHITEQICKIINNTASAEGSSQHWNYFNYFKSITPDGIVKFRASGNRLSNGLDDIHQVDLLPQLLLDVTREISINDLISSLPANNIGHSSYSVETSYGFVNGNDLFFAVWRQLLHSKSERDFSRVLEIGGGYGGFARTFINGSTKLESYTIVELPLSASLAAYYLHETTTCSIILNERNLRRVSDSPTIKILTTDFYQKDNQDTYDLVINTRSMGEMTNQIIKSYFDFFQPKVEVGGCFFNLNRYLKSSSGDIVRICDFPYDERWDVVDSEVAFNQRRLHCLITRRTENTEVGNIKSELGRISEFSESSVPPDYKLEETNFGLGVRTKTVFRMLILNAFRAIPSAHRRRLARLLQQIN